MKNSVDKKYYGLVFFSLIASSVCADNQNTVAPSWSTPTRGTSIETVLDNDVTLFTVAGSTQQYSQKQIDDKFNAPDWFPSQHEKMPEVVQYGKAPKVWACASCHLASGSGHPESASLAGLDSQYLQTQMRAFADGSRVDYSGHMNRMAKELSDIEIKEISNWFSALTPKVITKVVETPQVPKTYIDDTRMRLKKFPVKMEDIANRIIEIPVDLNEVKNRHPESEFISYVPVGSIARGKELVTSGGGKTIACASCHGEALNGNTVAPSIIGNFAIYTVRQLYGFKGGTRSGGSSAMMLGVVSALTDDDIIDISAFLTSLPIK